MKMYDFRIYYKKVEIYETIVFTIENVVPRLTNREKINTKIM